MIVTVPTVNICGVRSYVTIINNNLGDVKDKWIGNNNSGLEKSNIEYIKRELKL